MRDVAIVAFSQAKNVRRDDAHTFTEMLQPVIQDVFEKVELERKDIDFIVSGSCDYLSGLPFSFVHALDAASPWPPKSESHVEADGAWALYEAWLKIQTGQVKSALVYCFGKSSEPDELRDVLALQFDPYYQAPLWPDSVSVAALQARAAIDAGVCNERDMASVAALHRSKAKSNPFAQLQGDFDVDALLASDFLVDPLRKHDCPPISDGASAMIICDMHLAKQVCDRPVWIRGIDTRIESHSLGARDLSKSVSSELCAKHLDIHSDKLDIAEIHGPFSHQQIILEKALGVSGDTDINPSGGALAANPIMVAGLTRIGEVAQRMFAGEGDVDRGIAHATSGPCLQHNLLCLLEGD